MKITPSFNRLSGVAAALVLVTGCATQQEPPRTLTPIEIVRPAPPPPAPLPPPRAVCREDTATLLNRSGIEVLPFMRSFFADVYGDGVQGMIVGGKNGTVSLYRPDPSLPGRWQPAPGYFSGVKVGAFSSPALADIDGDGRPELLVGTGGFSSESGKVYVYRNTGDRRSPHWERVGDAGVSVGNDAAIAVVDYNGDGRPDLIIGNSEGKIFFYRNAGTPGRIGFVRDNSPFGSRRFDMYAVPAAIRLDNKVALIIGSGNGKLHRYDIGQTAKGLTAVERKIGITAKTFAAPAFASLVAPSLTDLVVSDSDGTITYYENVARDFSVLRRRSDLFGERFFAGPACTPTLSEVRGQTVMVIGNIDGTLKLFGRGGKGAGIPWVERPDYFKGIKVAGFSRGLLTMFEGRELLITGQGNGMVRAFFNSGTAGKPSWKEEAGFFRGVTIPQHSTPVVFDIDGDGQWELVSGAADGRIYIYKLITKASPAPAPAQGKIAKLLKPKNAPKPERVWVRIHGPFDDIKVGGFSAPSLVRDGQTIHLFVGQQDGRIRVFNSDTRGGADMRSWRILETELSSTIGVAEYCSPSVSIAENRFEVLAGDYNGNLRHFVCEKDRK